jgi:hypothetical protein
MIVSTPESVCPKPGNSYTRLAICLGEEYIDATAQEVNCHTVHPVGTGRQPLPRQFQAVACPRGV